MSGEVLWALSRATGVLSLVLFTAVVVLGMATSGRAGASHRVLSKGAVHRLHREMSLVAMVFLIVHIGTILVDGYAAVNLLDVFIPFGAGYSPLWIGLGAVAVDLMLAIGISSLIRTRIPRRLWRGIHLTAYAMWPLAVLHGLFTDGGDGSSLWLQMVLATNVAAVIIAAVLWRRRSRHPDAVTRRAADRRYLVGSGQ